jgi:thioredoxin 1
MPLNLNSEAEFEKEVLNSPIPVMVDFWAEWCGPCKVLSPIIDEIATEFKEQLKVVKVDVDKNNALTMKYGVMSMPTLKFFKNGKQVGEMIGAAPKNTLVNEIKKYL